MKDAQGGVLPGVTVEARHADGAVTSSVTDADGTVRFPSLLPGRYEVTAALESFKTGKVENLELLLGQIKSVNLMLEIAAVTEEVVVKAEAPAIDFDRQQRLSVQVDSTWYGKLAGEHALKGGFQIDHLANSVNYYETEPYAQLYYATDGSQRYRNQTGAFGFYRFRVALPTGTSRGFSTTGDVGTTNYGLFIQDAWTINNRVTVNLGLRTETERVLPFQPGLDLATGLPAEGTPEINTIVFGLQEKPAPRLGVAWDDAVRLRIGPRLGSARRVAQGEADVRRG